MRKLTFIKDGNKKIIKDPKPYEILAAILTKESWDQENPENIASIKIEDTDAKKVE